MKLKLTVLLAISIQLAIFTGSNANVPLKQCSYNEFCIDIKQCPTYKRYANESFPNWPQEWRSKAKENLCNREKVGDLWVASVCCPSVMNNEKCGAQGDDRISKGQVAKPFEFPWMALLQDKSGEFVCGGTLVSSRYVLTAAHCVRLSNIVSVRLGENDIDKVDDCILLDEELDCAPPPQDILVDADGIIRHPEYSARYKKNDIALLRLASPAKLGHSVKTVCLPDGTPDQRKLTPWNYIVSGWGLTEEGIKSSVLRYARVPAVTQDACSSTVRTLHAAARLDDSHLCAGGIDQVDNCAGDSGGPLHYVSNSTSRYVQQGVVAFGIKSCGLESVPGVYTNVGHFLSWIVQHVDE